MFITCDELQMLWKWSIFPKSASHLFKLSRSRWWRVSCRFASTPSWIRPSVWNSPRCWRRSSPTRYQNSKTGASNLCCFIRNDGLEMWINALNPQPASGPSALILYSAPPIFLSVLWCLFSFLESQLHPFIPCLFSLISEITHSLIVATPVCLHRSKLNVFKASVHFPQSLTSWTQTFILFKVLLSTSLKSF